MFALVLFSADEPGVLYALKWGPPIVLGLGTGENFVASDATALLAHTRDLIFLEDGDLARVTASSVTVTGFDGTPRERPAHRVPWDAVSAEKGGYPHYMAKEIAEQPTVVIETIGNKLSLETGLFNEEEMGVPRALLGGVDRLQIVACGTSWHAGLVGKFLLEEIARIPADVDYASEFRYRSPLVDGKTLVLGISQSGETADTVAALKEARRLGARTTGLVNVPGSAIARMVDGVIATHAGPEIGVASTKAFTTQLVALALLRALREGRARDGRSPSTPRSSRASRAFPGRSARRSPSSRRSRRSPAVSRRRGTSSSSGAARITRSPSKGRSSSRRSRTSTRRAIPAAR